MQESKENNNYPSQRDLNYDVGKIESKTEYNNNKLSKMKFIPLQKSVQLQQKSSGLQHIYKVYCKYIQNVFL